ncbi:hypothetical protein [Paraburkholderia azotifigens]|uniref:hypothetical protein n=1 Tax=Paraburkholderia azotifigens TaxID=2057004 RepID=UPI00308400DB
MDGLSGAELARGLRAGCAAFGLPASLAAALATAWAPWIPGYEQWLRNLSIMSQGLPAFFTPRADAWLALQTPVGIEQAAFYHTEPLRETLGALIDFDYLNGKETRLTVGTVGVGSGQMRYFTNRDEPLDVGHVMASAAFRRAFHRCESTAKHTGRGASIRIRRSKPSRRPAAA